ncbi:substrate-binding domain-containing protein [Nonomuraea spiralis]|uniref:Substrate-binding domain-containing protein n=1 Tax=Nonomuraea spiralis TaxID=46182 RepID=A0ABV5I836_9ACTN|nr:substrate-binding domain-containing protein [Nonomuraea spiralis]
MLPVNAHDLRPYWDTFRLRHPQWRLRLQHASFVDPFAGVRRGDVEALVGRLPIEEPDLTAGPVLFAEPAGVAGLLGRRLHAVPPPLGAPDRTWPAGTQHRGGAHPGRQRGDSTPWCGVPRPRTKRYGPWRRSSATSAPSRRTADRRTGKKFPPPR